MNIIYKLLLIIITPVAFFVILFCLLLLAYRIYFRKEFNSLPPDETQIYKKPNLLKTILIDLPKTFMRDLSTNNPNEFKTYGLHFIVGEQGCGKTITMNYLIRKFKHEYPKLLIKVASFSIFSESGLSWVLYTNGSSCQKISYATV